MKEFEDKVDPPWPDDLMKAAILVDALEKLSIPESAIPESDISDYEIPEYETSE